MNAATIIRRLRENSPETDTIIYLVSNYPDSDSALDRAAAAAGGEATAVRQTLELPRPWRSSPDTLTFEATYHLRPGRTVAELNGIRVPLDEPVALSAVHVPKPWGREIWFTGIEARGESRVRGAGGELPLSQYLALAPRRLCGNAPLVLLKILDPAPRPVLGDLYFELHEEKREVYVVTHVDRGAWPDGRGRIRFGMNQARRRQYADDARFRRDYLAAVQAYEQVRRAIDAGSAVPAERERSLRDAMEAFTEVRELAIGDVVVVPTRLPHSLQHGVRVIEFQTPTYERYVISFAQRVLTQDHWDTEAAVPRMRLDAPAPPTFEAVAAGVEQIVDFDDFRVWRMTLAPGEACRLPEHPSYAVCIGVQGAARLGALTLHGERAAFVPGTCLKDAARPPGLHNAGSEPAVVLLAATDL